MSCAAISGPREGDQAGAGAGPASARNLIDRVRSLLTLKGLPGHFGDQLEVLATGPAGLSGSAEWTTEPRCPSRTPSRRAHHCRWGLPDPAPPQPATSTRDPRLAREAVVLEGDHRPGVQERARQRAVVGLLGLAWSAGRIPVVPLRRTRPWCLGRCQRSTDSAQQRQKRSPATTPSAPSQSPVPRGFWRQSAVTNRSFNSARTAWPAAPMQSRRPSTYRVDARFVQPTSYEPTSHISH